MRAINIVIPDDLEFSDLRLERNTKTGDVSFDTAIIKRIEAASGLPEGFFMSQAEDALAGLITTWYNRHIAAGGRRDPVADELIGEALAEEKSGQGFSYPPGRA